MPVLKPCACWKRQQESLPDAFGESINSMWNAFVSHSSAVNALSFEEKPFKVLFYSIYQDIYLRKPTECVSSIRRNSTHILPLCWKLYAVPCKCPTKNRYTAIVHCSTETNTENSFCPSTLIILHTYCSLSSRAKSGCIINGAAEQLVSTKKINDAKWWGKNAETI